MNDDLVPIETKDMNYLIEHVEDPYVFRDGDVILFSGTPDRVLTFGFFEGDDAKVVIDWKMGRLPVQPAESNLQLRAYLVMEPAPNGYLPELYQAFRPSNLLRRKSCPGSLFLEGQIPSPPDDTDGTRYAAEGTLLHSHLADRTKSRDGLEPEQHETLLKAEAMEAEFLEIVKKQMKPGWGYGAIAQPRISSKPYIVAYSPGDLEASRKEILSLWKAAHQKDAQRHPSADACRHCRATAICEEHKAWIMAVEKVAHLPAASWSAQDWDRFLSRKSALLKFIDERYEEAKQIKAANPEAIPGWELQDGHERRVCSDVVAAFQRLQATLSPQEFSTCCELSLTSIEKLIWQKGQESAVKVSQKDVKRTVNAVLDGIITFRRNRPSLVKTEE